MQKILVTDTLFIFPEHEAQLKDAGFEVVRMSGTMAETELVEAIRDKDGYILGGIEQVTAPVIEAADKLKVIAYTGADPLAYIPAYDLARSRGIKITATPGNTTFAVSELGMTLMLSMLRHIFELGGPGKDRFMVSQSLEELTVGIVGMGRIGERMARLLKAFGAKEIIYWNRTRKTDLEKELSLHYVELPTLFSDADLITNHVASAAGEFISHDLLNRTKQGVLMINVGGDNFDTEALYELLASGKARAAFDAVRPKDNKFAALPLSTWYKTNEGAGYLTHGALKMASDMSTTSIINILTTGSDRYIVNN